MNTLPTLDRVALNYADVPAKGFWRGEKSNHRGTGLRSDSLGVLAFGSKHFVKDGIEAARHAPAGIMTLQFRQIRDVTDVIALARLLRVDPVDFTASQRFNPRNCFEHRDAVAAPSAEVVDLAGPRIARKLLERADHIEAVNIVAHLLALIAEDRVGMPRQGYLQQVGEEAMQLDAGVRRPGQAPAAENAHA